MPFNAVNMLNFNKPRSTPSPYPFPTTYILSISSLLASLITAIILFYFSYYLQMDSVAVPPEFIFLIVTSITTLAATNFTIYIHIFRKMAPRTSLIVNGLVFVLWIVGLALITAKIGSMVLGHSCKTPMWVTPTGMMVCRIYKALYSFIVVATASAGASVILDISVSNEQSRRGAYREMKDEGKTIGMAEPSPGLKRGFYSNLEMKGNSDLGVKGVEFDARYDGDDDTTQLVSKTPDLSGEKPQLKPLILQGRSMSNFWRREVESPAVRKNEAVRT